MKALSTFAVAFMLIASAATAQIIPDQYIVVLNNNAPAPGGVAQGLVNQFGGNVGHVYNNAIKGFSFQGNAIAAAAIARNPNVAYVEADLEAHAVAQTLVTGVDRMDVDLNTTAKIDGLDDRVNVDVAVLDTGIDLDHPDLPAVVGGKHFYSITSGRPQNRGSFEDDDYDDDEGHGTHVAGTIAALDNDIGVVGVAPGARLWAIKILDSTGSGSFSDIIKGIDFVTANADQIQVANMSLSGQGSLVSLQTAIQNSVAAGIVYVVAAANDSMDVYGPDGTYGTNDDVIPASYPEVAAISAMGDTDGQDGGAGAATSFATGDDTFASFTNFSSNVIAGNPVNSPGAAIDVAGPGVDITSTYPGGGYAIGSGTSMASPHVAGLAALEVATNGRALNATGVSEIRQALIDAAQPQTDWGPANTFDPDNNAEGLAMAASGPANDAPLPAITSPADGATFASGATVAFTGTAIDSEDGTITENLAWSSDIDSAIGTGGSASKALSDGEHTITASITDSGGKTRTASINIRVGDPPDVATEAIVSKITYTTSGGRGGNKNLLIAIEVKDDFGALVAGASVSISLSRDGSPSGTGTASTGSDGTVTFQLRNAGAGCYTTDVTNITAAGLTFDGSEPTVIFCK
jgi:subtilisin